MKAKIIVTAAIDEAAINQSLVQASTDMLLLGCFHDGGPGPVKLFDEVTEGKLSAWLEPKGFTGALGERFTYLNEGGSQKHLLVIGLGAGSEFGCRQIARVLGIAIHKAVKHECTKLTIPFFSSRFGSGLNLKAQAHVTLEAATVKLEEYDGDGELVIELLCLKSAKRQLQAGLRLPLTGDICCSHVDGTKATPAAATPRKAGCKRTAAKKD